MAASSELACRYQHTFDSGSSRSSDLAIRPGSDALNKVAAFSFNVASTSFCDNTIGLRPVWDTPRRQSPIAIASATN